METTRIRTNSAEEDHRHEIHLSLRQARADDARLLWDWANDPVVRASSLSPDFIEWDAHLAWFEAKLSSESTLIFIAECTEDGAPLGQVRFDMEEAGSAAIDISVAASSRRSSVGTALLERGLAEVQRRSFCDKVVARVKDGNAPSRHLFEKACFTCIGSQTFPGSRLFVYQRILPLTSPDAIL